MTKLASFAFVLIASLAACKKAPDMGRMQEESLAYIKSHGRDLDTMQRRREAVFARGRQLGPTAPGIPEAGLVLNNAAKEIERVRGLLASAPSTIAAKTNNAEELEKASAELIAQIDEGMIKIRADLAALENWVSSADSRSNMVAARSPIATGGTPEMPPPPSGNPPPSDNPPTTPPPSGANAPQGNAGGSAPGGQVPGGTPPAPPKAPEVREPAPQKPPAREPVQKPPVREPSTSKPAQPK